MSTSSNNGFVCRVLILFGDNDFANCFERLGQWLLASAVMWDEVTKPNVELCISSMLRLSLLVNKRNPAWVMSEEIESSYEYIIKQSKLIYNDDVDALLAENDNWMNSEACLIDIERGTVKII